MRPLAATLAALIRAEGPIGIDRFMALALGHPEHGYYMRGDPFGRAGDFTTAPEISQMFGELIGLWCAETWRLMGRPNPFLWVELGPGRGTLMADALRAARRVPGFLDAAAIHLVETSPALRARQRATLAGHDVSWHESVADLPGGPMVLVANEFLDALPIRQFVRGRAGWHERLVGLADDRTTHPPHAEVAGAAGPRSTQRNTRTSFEAPPPAPRDSGAPQDEEVGSGFDESRLQFGLAPIPAPDLRLDAPDGAVIEIAQAAREIVGAIAARLVLSGGAALFVDYGSGESGFGDTLQAMRGHRFTDPLAEPGSADLTAHVDFAALGRAALEAGAALHGPVEQGAFLATLGISERARQLARARPDHADSLAAAHERLAGRGQGQMGALFKVLAVSSPDPATLPGLPPAAAPEPQARDAT